MGESYRAASASLFTCNHNRAVRALAPALRRHSCVMGCICPRAHSPWISSVLLLSSMGIRAWRMASAQASPSSPAATQYTSEAVATSKEWALSPGNKAVASWVGPRTCSTCDRLISCRRTGEFLQIYFRFYLIFSHFQPYSIWCCSHSETR